MQLTAKNFFTFYIFHPLHPQLEKQRDRKIALIATLALGIFAGIAHLFVRLFIYNKNFLSNHQLSLKTTPHTPRHSEEQEESGSTTQTETPYRMPVSPFSPNKNSIYSI